MLQVNDGEAVKLLRDHDRAITTLTTVVDRINVTLEEFSNKLDKLVQVHTDLALLRMEAAGHTAAIERGFKRLEAVEQNQSTGCNFGESVKKRVDKLETILSRVAWLVITPVVMAIIGLVIVK